MGTEIELTFKTSPRDLDRLMRAGPIAATEPRQTQTLESVYFDTPDNRLAEARAALRVRRVDGENASPRFIQALKVGEGLVRGEWETEVSEAKPDLAALAATGCADILEPLRGQNLSQVFSTTVERETRVVTVTNGAGKASRVEVALDRGTIRAGRRKSRITEIELELEHGSPSALYDLARDLGAEVPLRLEPRSKALRGHLLARDQPPPHQKAERLVLDGDAPVEDGMALIFTSCLDHFQANLPTAVDGREPEGVHQLRVALRRLRSAFATFGGALPDAQLTLLKDEVRWILAALGPARDLDVQTTELLAPPLVFWPDDPGLQALKEAFEGAREGARRRVRSRLEDPRTTKFLIDIRAWIAHRGWREAGTHEIWQAQQSPLRAFAQATLDKRLKRARRIGRDLEMLPFETRHELRIALKKLRYPLDFFRSLFEAKGVKGALDALSELQDQLGAMNDLHTAETLLAKVAGRSEARGREVAHAIGLVIGWHGNRIAAAEGDTAGLWKAFSSAKPVWRKNGSSP